MARFLDRLDEVDGLLEGALNLPRAEQPRFLDEMCGSDEELRKLLDKLLANSGAVNDILDRGVAALAIPILDEIDASASLLEQRIGPYRIGRKIGEGGMGTVYLGERVDGEFERQVAIKVVRHGLESPDVQERLRHERQILASLRHPNIAALYDGGITAEGHPYLLMEYVEGVPITEYCDRNKLTPQERLQLFRTVCRAVQHAHQNLIVHRDLKPSNILVTDDGTVKLLDFGISKLLDEASLRTTPLTRTGLHLMTPEYASPEQIRGEPLTTASDVYALGVLLYELLIGTRPYRVKSRLQHEMTRVVLEDEPIRPSTALTQELPDDLTSQTISEARNTTVDGLRRQLRGDLDNITLKALTKEPNRRYGTAEGLSADLERYLDGLPVEARPATISYRMGKFVKRHRHGVLASVAVFLLLVGMTAFYTTRIAAERDHATLQAEKAEQVTEFVVSLFDAADPDRRDRITARDLLDDGRARVFDELADQPEIQAEMLVVMGRLYGRLGLYTEADSLLNEAVVLRRDAYGEYSLPVAEALYEQGVVRRQLGVYDEAENLHEASLAIRRSFLRADHSEIAESSNELGLVAWRQGDYATADRHHRQALAARRAVFGDTSLPVSTSLNNLGISLIYQSRNEEALPLLEEALDIRVGLLRTEDSRVATVVDNIALAYDNLNRSADAEPRRREALAIRRAVFGDEHPSVAVSLINLGATLRNMDRLDEAEPFLRESWLMRQRLLGEDHPQTLTSQRLMGDLLGQNGRHAEAETLLQDALARFRNRLGPEHPDVALTLMDLGRLLHTLDRDSEARPLLTEALDMNRRLLGPDHPRTQYSENLLNEAMQTSD